MVPRFPVPRFQSPQHYRLHKRGVYSELGGETESLLTPDFVKLSHNGASDAQAVYLWVGVAIGIYVRAQVCKPGYCLYCLIQW